MSARKVSPLGTRTSKTAAARSDGPSRRKAAKKASSASAGANSGPRKSAGQSLRTKSPPNSAPRGATQPQSKPALLSGGNPQITKGDGDAPVQAYISAMPEWKSLVGRRLDALIEKAVPGVRKAVKWNSPFYGVDGQGWFLSFHCFSKYVKVAFLRGGSLTPLPPGASKHRETRYLDIYEADELDEAQLMNWFRQSAAMPGWDGGSPRLNGGIPL